jgi:cytoplasmic tRNA 2-thiolation protein 1
LDIGAQKVHATKVAVGHNADDVSETILLNILRGDITRFARSVDVMTDGIESKTGGAIIAPRIKPFVLASQREIVYYAHFNQLLYYAVECPYALQAFRRFPRMYLVEKQREDPGLMRRIVEGAMKYQTQTVSEEAEIIFCQKCGAACNHEVCMACKLVERLKDAHAARPVVADPEPAPAEHSANPSTVQEPATPADPVAVQESATPANPVALQPEVQEPVAPANPDALQEPAAIGSVDVEEL